MHMLKLISTFVGSALLVTPAAAEPIDDFMARVNQYLGAAGGSLTYVIGPGYSDTNKGLTPLVLTTPAGEAIPLGDNAYIGTITTLSEEIILGEGLQFANFSRSFAGVTATAGSVILDLALPPLGTTDPLILAQSLKAASVFELHVEEDGVALDIAQMGYFLFVSPGIGAPDPANLTFNFSIEGLAVTDAMLRKLDAPPTLSVLAGHKVDLDVRLDWKRDMAQLTPVSVEVKVVDFGDLGFSIDLGGVTDEVIMRLVALGQQLSATGSTPELQQQVIPLLSQLTVHSLYSGVFNNGGGEAILMAIAGNGGSKASILRSGTRNLRDSLTNAGLPELGAVVSDAFATMMLNNGGVVVSGYPEVPVGVLELVALGSTSPQALVSRLAVIARYEPPMQ